jgi:hypothetical protein
LLIRLFFYFFYHHIGIISGQELNVRMLEQLADSATFSLLITFPKSSHPLQKIKFSWWTDIEFFYHIVKHEQKLHNWKMRLVTRWWFWVIKHRDGARSFYRQGLIANFFIFFFPTWRVHLLLEGTKGCVCVKRNDSFLLSVLFLLSHF